MSNINEFLVIHTSGVNGYEKLAAVMTGINTLNSVLETDIEIKNIDDCTFNVRCFDGVALAVNDKMNVVLEYPTKNELTHEQLKECLRYRGLEVHISQYMTLTSAKTTFGDIMMLMGEPIMIHYKK